jgi:NAD(P)H-hydrate epimerase
VIPTVTVDQMREVDRLMVDEFGIELIQMMENAGRALAEHTRRWLDGDVRGRRVVVLAGRGGNGGGGLAAARRLSIWGADVSVVLGQDAANLDPVPARQLAILGRLGVPVSSANIALPAGLNRAEIILDALIGYSLRGAPREAIATLITAANAAAAPTISLDIPSGLGGDSGEPESPTVRAASTLTLALPKAGLVRSAAREWVGDLYLADISVPPAVYSRLGIEVGPIFATADIIPVNVT